jgi:hypothetical protein
MKKAYENTIDEAIAPCVRLAEMTGALARQRWNTLFIAPLAFPLFYLLMSRHEMQIRLIAAGFMTVVVTIGTMLAVKDQARLNARRVMKKAQGTDRPVTCEYELTDEHLAFRKLGQELRFDWRTVKTVSLTPSAIEVVLAPTGIALIPRRIFSSPEELQQWYRFIEDHRAANTASQPIAGKPGSG